MVKLAVLPGLGSRRNIVDIILAWQTDNYLDNVGEGEAWGGDDRLKYT